MRLERCAQIANIVALLPAAYCAYGTYIVLHTPNLPAPVPSQSLVEVAGTVTIRGIVISLVIFLSCVAIGAIINIIANAQSRRERIGPLSRQGKFAGGQAALLCHFAARARGFGQHAREHLASLEQFRGSIIHPLNINHPKNFGAENALALVDELRDFKLLYRDHLSYLKSEVPGFSSSVTSHGFPSDREYPEVISDLRAHASSLDDAAQQVWDTERPLELPDPKK